MKQTEKKKDCLGKRNGPEHRENLEIHAKPGPAQGEGKKRSAGTGGGRGGAAGSDLQKHRNQGGGHAVRQPERRENLLQKGGYAALIQDHKQSGKQKDVYKRQSLDRAWGDFAGELNKGVKGLKIALPKQYFGEGISPEVKGCLLYTSKKCCFIRLL